MLETLTDTEKRALLEGRLRTFALESYGHELNKQVAAATGDLDAVAAADAAIATIATAAATYEQELAALPASDVAAPQSELG